MKLTKRQFFNFSHAVSCKTDAARPEHPEELISLFKEYAPQSFLARGRGLSYSDCCLLSQGLMIDTSRLNHFLKFNPETGLVACQGAVTFADLFKLDANFIPPVIPGTLHATVAGGVANDVHGKNNHKLGSLSQHVEWLELQISDKTYHCSREINADLFKATFGGIGLTGVITKIGLYLRKKKPVVCKKTTKFNNLESLLLTMQDDGIQYDYQVAWLDLLNTPRGLLTTASHISETGDESYDLTPHKVNMPYLPFRLINGFFMKQFNKVYYHLADTKKKTNTLWRFNNPLDKINNWNTVYGKRGLLQFQGVFPEALAYHSLTKIIRIIEKHQATPTLAVLKYFTQPGEGLLSFSTPGFTVAIDFINNLSAKKAITALNEYIAAIEGKVYLAKDLLLNQRQFIQMYPQYETFLDVLAKYQSPMYSDLARRLELGL